MTASKLIQCLTTKVTYHSCLGPGYKLTGVYNWSKVKSRRIINKTIE